MPTCTQISDTFLKPGTSPMFHVVLQVNGLCFDLKSDKGKKVFSLANHPLGKGSFLSATCWPNGVKLFG